MTVYQPVVSVPSQQLALLLIPTPLPPPLPPVSYIQPQPIYMEIDHYNPLTIPYENKVPALTYIKSEIEDEPIDVDVPLAMEAAPELLALEAAPELLAL